MPRSHCCRGRPSKCHFDLYTGISTKRYKTLRQRLSWLCTLTVDVVAELGVRKKTKKKQPGQKSSPTLTSTSSLILFHLFFRTRSPVLTFPKTAGKTGAKRVTYALMVLTERIAPSPSERWTIASTAAVPRAHPLKIQGIRRLLRGITLWAVSALSLKTREDEKHWHNEKENETGRLIHSTTSDRMPKAATSTRRS